MFRVRQKVRLKHCDPAGIGFFPRYCEMINDVVEDWFEEVIGHRFSEIHRTGAAPTAAIQVTFKNPLLLGRGAHDVP